MMLDLSDQETDALAGLRRRTIDDDRYPLSPRLSGCRARGLAAFGKRTHLTDMILDLTHEETDALARLLSRTSTMTVTRCRPAFKS